MSAKTTALAAAILATSISVAHGQASCPQFTYKQVLTAAQWQACFDGKQSALGYQPVNKAGDTMTGPLVMAPATASGPSVTVQPGVAPASPSNGAMWSTAFGAFFFMNGVTYNLVQSYDLAPLNSGAVLAGGATRFFVVSGNAVEAIAAAVAPQGGTFSHFYAKVDTAPAGGETVTFTLRVNGVDTAVTCAIAAAATSCNDTAHSAPVLEGQDWSVKAVSSASAASTAARGGILLVNP